MLLKLVGLVFPLRAERSDESVGLDLSMHGEEAYVHAEVPVAARGDGSSEPPGLRERYERNRAMKLKSQSTSRPVVILRISTSIRNWPVNASRMASDHPCDHVRRFGRRRDRRGVKQSRRRQ